MLVLAIDTCDANGSVAVLRDGLVGGTTTHPADADYSSWLLPTVDVLLAVADARLRDVELFAVATGPGSFTGVRIGLTTVKAWSEVFGRPIAAMSRLEVLAAQARSHAPFVATFIDAQRGQVFGALYKRNGPDLVLCRDEAVIGASDFIGQVREEAGSSQVEWVSTDSSVMGQQDGWQERAAQGERILEVAPMLTPLIGELGVQKASKGELQDAVSLDANYVRRSYVEMPVQILPMNQEPDSGPRTRALIRQYVPDDASVICALGKLAVEAAQWSAASYEQAAESGQTVLIAEEGLQICGFLVSRLVGSEGEILNMAIAPGQRRKGIGSKLLAAVEEEAKAKSAERMYLEVRESNSAALAFYEKHGFAKSGRRTNYYRNPTENAVVLEKKLTG